MDIKTTPKKNFRWYMRNLHNQVGFFIVGLVIIYVFSGIVQTYRDTDLLKHAVVHDKELAPGLDNKALGEALKQRNFKVTKTEGDVIYFEGGSYNAVSGAAQYTTKELYNWVKPFTELHKSNSKPVVHYLTLAFAIALLFLSISAFWMFKPGTRLFSRGVIMTVVGVVAAVLMLILQGS